MALTNPTLPAPFNFSKNFIPLSFTSDNSMEQTGVNSYNLLMFSGVAITAGTLIKFKFGATEVVFTAAAAPNDSGLQFPTGDGSTAYIASLVQYFTANSLIDQNFNLIANLLEIRIDAKRQATGYDIATHNFTGGLIHNINPGRAAIQRTNFAIQFELFCQTADHSGFEKVYSTSLPVKFNTAGVAEVDIAERLNAYLEKDIVDFPDMSSSTPLHCKKSCRKFYYTYAESWGQPLVVKKKYRSAEYTVLAGGLSTKGAFSNMLSSLLVPMPADAAKDRFLKQGNNHQYTRHDQPQFLYFFNSRGTSTGVKLMVRFHYTDESESAAITLQSFTLSALSKYAFNVTPKTVVNPLEEPEKTLLRYEIWLAASNNLPLSETRTYYLNYKAQQYVRYFISWSSWGALDSRLCYGQATSSLELAQQSARRIRKSGDDIKKGDRSIFDLKLTNKFKVSTGHISRTELIHNRDFFLSAYKFRYSGGLFLPVEVTSKSIEEIKDDETRFYQNFEYEYCFEDDVFTEGDVEEPGLGIEGFFFNSVNPLLPSNGLVETDPTVPSWVKAITQADIAHWNQFNISGYNKANWDASFSWGDHALAGYALAANHYDKTTSDTRFIRNQNTLQAGAELNIAGGRFNNYLVIPTTAPTEPTAGAIWISAGGTSGGGPGTGGGAQFLHELVDVAITTPVAGQSLVYNGVNWINQNATVDAWTKTESDSRYLGIGATAVAATHLKAKYIYPNNITDGVSAFDLASGSLTTVAMHENHALFGGFATTLTMSGYDQYGAAQISVEYNAVTPKLAVRNFNQGLNNWNSWERIVTSSMLGSNAFNSTAYLPLNGTAVAANAVPFTGVTGKPTNLAGYGITDAYPLTGNPAGYLTAFSETDPVYTGSSWYTTTNNSANWNTAFSWGNHAAAGYALTANHYEKTVSDSRYIRNQNTLQSGAELNVKGGKFNEYVTIPLGAPAVPTPGAIWISDGGTSGGGPGGGAQFLYELVDVAITTPVAGQSLVWNGVNWINQNATVDAWTKSESDSRYLSIGATAVAATYAQNSTRLYASDAPYNYGQANPYYAYMTYSGINRWRLQVSPATPAGIEVEYADYAGLATNSTKWSGQDYVGETNTNPSGEVMAFNTATNRWNPTSLNQLGLGSAAYLNASTSGIAPNTVVLRNSSGQIEAYDIYLNYIGGGYLSSLVNKETLQSVTDRGTITTNKLTFQAGLDIYAGYGVKFNPFDFGVYADATYGYFGKYSNGLGLRVDYNTGAVNIDGTVTAPTFTGSLNGNANTATNAELALKFNSSSHAGAYWLVNNWDGTYWNITSNHGSPARVGYADNAGTATNWSGSGALDNYLLKSGGTLTGPLTGTVITAPKIQATETLIIPLGAPAVPTPGAIWIQTAP